MTRTMMRKIPMQINQRRIDTTIRSGNTSKWSKRNKVIGASMDQYKITNSMESSMESRERSNMELDAAQDRDPLKDSAEANIMEAMNITEVMGRHDYISSRRQSNGRGHWQAEYERQ